MASGKKRGFVPSEYFLAPSRERWSFTTQQISQQHGVYVWTGEIAGDTMNGVLVWTKPDTTILQYTFEGRKAAAVPSTS